jgi:hypothetical protein
LIATFSARRFRRMTARLGWADNRQDRISDRQVTGAGRGVAAVRQNAAMHQNARRAARKDQSTKLQNLHDTYNLPWDDRTCDIRAETMIDDTLTSF